MTKTESRDFMKHMRDSGWDFQDNNLNPIGSQSSTIEFRIPEPARMMQAFALDVLTALDDWYNTESQIIELTEWKLGTSLYDEIGWKTWELMRRGHGELRPLEAAPAQLFRFDEALEARALLMQIFVHQWSAMILPMPISHVISVDEEHLTFHLSDPQVAIGLSDKLKRWEQSIDNVAHM